MKPETIEEQNIALQKMFACDSISVAVYYGPEHGRMVEFCQVAAIIEKDMRREIMVTTGDLSFCGNDSFESLYGLNDDEMAAKIEERIAEIEHRIRILFENRVDAGNQFRRIVRMLEEK